MHTAKTRKRMWETLPRQVAQSRAGEGPLACHQDRGGAEGWICFAVALICAGLLCPPNAGAADGFLDDHGDAPGEGTLIVPGSTSTNGTIEIDVDEDWFRFVALPGVAYRLEVGASSIWDTVVTMLAPDRAMVMMATNSARSPGPAKATITWTNTGVAGTYYVGVSGYLRFTTGTYAMVVQPLDWMDTDDDGLPDAWEIERLKGLAYGAADDPDGDGERNLDEYYGATDPASRLSTLTITLISKAAQNIQFQWPGAPFASYRVMSSGGPFTNAWTSLGTNRNMSPSTVTEQWTTSCSGTMRMYRVEQIIGE